MSNQIANRTVEFTLLTGAVTSSQKHAETHVSSSGGGGFLHKGTGFVNAPVVRSHIVTKHEFWVHTDDGRDIPVNLSNVHVSVAEGHRVSLISAKVPDMDNAPLVLLINHNAKGHWFIPNKALINAMHEPVKFWPILVTVFMLFVGLKFSVVMLAGLAFGAYRLFRRYRLASASKARLGQHLEGIAQSLYSSPALEPPALPALPPVPAA
jgi:hypothetical protein